MRRRLGGAGRQIVYLFAFHDLSYLGWHCYDCDLVHFTVGTSFEYNTLCGVLKSSTAVHHFLIQGCLMRRPAGGMHLPAAWQTQPQGRCSAPCQCCTWCHMKQQETQQQQQEHQQTAAMTLSAVAAVGKRALPAAAVAAAVRRGVCIRSLCIRHLSVLVC
jgi:hypothetical protein